MPLMQKEDIDRDVRNVLAALILPLAFVNAILTFLVLVSPIGTSAGSGFIGNSIYRLLVYVLLQTPIAIFGIAGSVVSVFAGRVLWVSLVLHAAVFIATFFVYFYQSATVCAFMSC